ncbi:protein kinase [Priestia megaterium]|nr:protein kinase [Priestia megaterium]
MFNHFLKFVHRWIVDRPLKPGMMVDNRYEVKKLLGMGSYGLTYVVWDRASQKEAVLKQLRKTKQRTIQGMHSFGYEQQILSKLNHPQIPSLHHVIEHDEGSFLIMDVIKGKTFEDLIFEEGKSYTEHEVLHILLQILEVVAYLHQEGVVHRDLRIPNIIDVNGTIHIIDFGLARFLDDQENIEHLVTEQQYMREISIKSDLYALGHFVLFLLYSSYQPKTKAEKSWEEELALSPGVTAIIKKMLQVNGCYDQVECLRRDINECINQSFSQYISD